MGNQWESEEVKVGGIKARVVKGGGAKEPWVVVVESGGRIYERSFHYKRDAVQEMKVRVWDSGTGPSRGYSERKKEKSTHDMAQRAYEEAGKKEEPRPETNWNSPEGKAIVAERESLRCIPSESTGGKRFLEMTITLDVKIPPCPRPSKTLVREIMAALADTIREWQENDREEVLYLSTVVKDVHLVGWEEIEKTIEKERKKEGKRIEREPGPFGVDQSSPLPRPGEKGFPGASDTLFR